MKKFLATPQFLILFLFAFALRGAQAEINLRVSANATNLSIGQSVTYTIIVSNTSPAQLQSVQIYNTFPANATILNAANTYSANGVATNNGQVLFTIPTLPTGVQAQMSLQLRPAARGGFTNNVIAQAPASGVPAVSTNVGVNVGLAQVDLAVGVEGFPTNLVIGDVFDYTVTVTNFGPSIAGGVSVQSVLPTGMNLLSVTPNFTTTFNTNTRILTLNLGTLTNSFAQDVLVRMEASNAGAASIVTSVVTSENSDTASANDAVTNKFTALGFVTNNLAIIAVTPQKLNLQNGLMEQLVTVTNISTNTLSSVRLVVTNLQSPNRLYNVSGTNANRPYLMLPGPLAPGNSMNVLVQFVAPSRQPITANFVAVEGPNLNPLILPSGTVVAMSRFAQLWTAYDPEHPQVRYSSVYIEFPSTAGKTYSLVYATTVDGSNWVAAQPPLVANSSFGRFIDSGPVTGDRERIYRVIEHQQNQ